VKFLLVEADVADQCQPLTCTRSLGECAVANRPLAELQAEHLMAAGLHPAGTGEGEGELTLYVRQNAWLTSAFLAELATVTTGPLRVATAVDEESTVLAWLSDQRSIPSDGPLRACDEGSFAVRYPWDLLRINEQVVGALNHDLVAGAVSAAAEVDGHLVLGEGSRILPGVYIEGNVIIGRNCKIGPNCYLRGNTSIGDEVHIGQAVEIKNSIIMNGASIGHLSYCGDSIIGANVNFGAGTIVANLRHDGKNHRSKIADRIIDTGRRKFGTIVGDDVHTGIHTSIYPGRKLWPHTATLPGTVVAHDLH
jgi:bifunctional UDP-N-acetylglucosamine pyrophosphorylase/glucosamine-1-phosphate N-acetyltransferase